MENLKQYHVIGQNKGTLTYNGKCWAVDINQAKSQYDKSFVVTTDLPADFSIETYTIIDGQLSPASPEIIAERQAIQAIATHEATRQARQQRYDSEEISSLYWNWVESGNEADKAKWVAAKEAIRQELPYAQETGGKE